MVDVKRIIEETGGLYKFGGIAPEGFVLIHEKTLDDLKKFEIWDKWVNNCLNLQELDIIHFNSIND